MREVGPPAFAWDWLARQRLPWQEARRRLVRDGGADLAARYGEVDARHDVMARLREDHPVDARVRRTLEDVVVEVVFLGRVDVALSDRGVATPPRGLRWWHEHLAGATHPGAAASVATDAEPSRPPAEPRQLALALDDVLGGYGDPVGPPGPDRTPRGSEPSGSGDGTLGREGAPSAGTEAVA